MDWDQPTNGAWCDVRGCIRRFLCASAAVALSLTCKTETLADDLSGGWSLNPLLRRVFDIDWFLPPYLLTGAGMTYHMRNVDTHPPEIALVLQCMTEHNTELLNKLAVWHVLLYRMAIGKTLFRYRHMAGDALGPAIDNQEALVALTGYAPTFDDWGWRLHYLPVEELAAVVEHTRFPLHAESIRTVVACVNVPMALRIKWKKSARLSGLLCDDPHCYAIPFRETGNRCHWHSVKTVM